MDSFGIFAKMSESDDKEIVLVSLDSVSNISVNFGENSGTGDITITIPRSIATIMISNPNYYIGALVLANAGQYLEIDSQVNPKAPETAKKPRTPKKPGDHKKPAAATSGKRSPAAKEKAGQAE
jgi:hypothetical protein